MFMIDMNIRWMDMRASKLNSCNIDFVPRRLFYTINSIISKVESTTLLSYVAADL